ncbi:GntR family transcriptional regulator [Bradyrhizobium cosmicum]|uniref:GntR family transcriptional regulator n=1 Tax=Bradyrhizobium cosmicum TaxID=1404864 RepID=UPI0028E51E83|nr:GntR family transcriptional regulator [Bradyrhizobium cosmicum]
MNPSSKRVPSPGGGRFLYQTVTDTLRSRIASGAYPRGERIPSVDELATELTVSSITVRRAIRDLTLEGLLVGRQGLGVFVADDKRIVRTIDGGKLSALDEDMRASGIKASLYDRGISVVPPTDEVFLKGLVSSHASLYRLERLLLADGKVVGLDTLWLPRVLADKLKEHLQGEFIIPLLPQYGIIVDHTRYQIEATTATEAQAQVLDVVSGYPLLVVRYFPSAADGRPILAGQNVTRADRFTYTFTSRAE